MNHSLKMILAVSTVVLLCAAGGDGCTPQGSEVADEAARTNRTMNQISRNQPVPMFDWSLERRMQIEIYQARQRATRTYSVVQSPFTGKVLWACPSIGFPLPYATQLTNPHQAIWGDRGPAVVEQAEPNGLYSPAQADATWVPCVAPNGKIAPRYEENHVSVFLQPMVERDGQLFPAPDTTPSFHIDPGTR